jgi:hypothetical protein
VYWLYTEAGIRDESRFFEAPDTANYRIFGFKIKNVTSPSVPLKITGGYGVDGDSGDPMDIIDTTGGTIFCSPPHVVSYAVGSGVTPADIVAIRDEIKPDLVVVNNNVQKASLFIPASEDLPA